DQSVLIDPGSALIADEIIRKVDTVIGLHNVRWLVCSHVDPDILGALPAMVAHGLHPEARIVTHWRDEALIVHSGTPLKFWRIEENDWHLALEDRTLSFVFMPYLHFAGAFGTFDEESGTLFSSVLFGGFTFDHSLFAESVAYFDAIRVFHEHYMPNREILEHAIVELRRLAIRQIAPQHGQIIPEGLIAPIMNLLEKLECGIYLLARQNPGLAFLLAANQTIQGVVDTVVKERDFSVVATYMANLASQTLGAAYLEFWSSGEGVVLQFDQSDQFAGQVAEPPDDVARVMAGQEVSPGLRLILALTSSVTNEIDGAVVLGFGEATKLDEATYAVLVQVIGIVEVGLEREALLRASNLDRIAWMTRAVRDPLTDLYNRASLADSLRRLMAADSLGEVAQLAALMVDIDFFKGVNDTHGHRVGDRVLARVARAITSGIRSDDMAFRYGGEEFLVLLPRANAAAALVVAERIRTNLEASTGSGPVVQVSIGVAIRNAKEGDGSLVDRADKALYRAKANGRNRVVLG
ncbi:MAG: diguanylate cyclase, partial [Acidimicrobiaceae bacterium]|nr:diguanylate cyclase [Acidimicrobiaceae bacterium]